MPLPQQNRATAFGGTSILLDKDGSSILPHSGGINIKPFGQPMASPASLR